MWQAWLTLPSCLASSSRPTLARMIFCSLVMTVVLVNAEAGRCAPRPLRAQPRLMPQPNNTVCQIKSKLLHLKPHLVKTFKLSTDKHFVAKVQDVVGLYLDPPDKALVLAVDEKSQIQ